MFKVILWDVDGTLLDFKAAERAALFTCFRDFDLPPCTEEQLARYSAINVRYWKRLENGEITKAELLPGRFREFFREECIAFDRFDEFNADYQLRLGEQIFPIDDCLNLLTSLKGRVKQYAVTNGTRVAQERKLKKSGLDRILDGSFISEMVGAEKPSMDFFRPVLEAIGPYQQDEILIVGDSLTSDMRGGNRAGIRCCWFNPRKEPLPEDLRIDFNIQHLDEVLHIL